ncbi:MAG: cyclase family protein [Armatimonadota bacterium]|nr:cyclase family protein [Armatimonadota bacterium]
MRLIDLTHSISRRSTVETLAPVVVRSAQPVHLIPLERLVTLATVIDVRDSLNEGVITRRMTARTGVSGIAGCILRSDWCDGIISGRQKSTPVLEVDAASYLLEGGVRTIAADFPITTAASDLLLHNGCVLIHCISGIGQIRLSIVRLVALPLKLEDTYSAEARVIAIEEE